MDVVVTVHVAGTVRQLWTGPTFTRTLSADPAPVPLGFYLRFVDAPDVTAAAGRHLRLTTYNARVLGDDWYQADDGCRHAWRLPRARARRRTARRAVVGTHRGSIFGTVGGSALTRLEFAEDRGRTTQRLAVNVIIGNGVVAGITRTVLPLFGWFVDRKLAEGFRTGAAAAAWAHANTTECYAWLRGAFTADRRAELRQVFSECAGRLADRRPVLSQVGAHEP